MKQLVLVLLLVLLLVGCTPCPPCPTVEPTATVVVPTATPTPEPWTLEWDTRMDRLKVWVDWDGADSERFWPIAVWITEDGIWKNADDAWAVPSWAGAYLTASFTEAGGATHMYGRALTVDGDTYTEKGYRFYWPDGEVGGLPEASGWSNFFASARYDPAVGSGPYCLETLNGVPVCGGGQPYGGPHVSIFVVWKARW